MSKGLEIIGDFNNENREDVRLIKQKAVELIDVIWDNQKDPRRASIATTQIELGVMMAVKSLFTTNLQEKRAIDYLARYDKFMLKLNEIIETIIPKEMFDGLIDGDAARRYVVSHLAKRFIQDNDIKDVQPETIIICKDDEELLAVRIMLNSDVFNRLYRKASADL